MQTPSRLTRAAVEIRAHRAPAPAIVRNTTAMVLPSGEQGSGQGYDTADGAVLQHQGAPQGLSPPFQAGRLLRDVRRGRRHRLEGPRHNAHLEGQGQEGAD